MHKLEGRSLEDLVVDLQKSFSNTQSFPSFTTILDAFVNKVSQTSPIDIQESRFNKQLNEPIMVTFFNTFINTTMTNPLTYLTSKSVKTNQGSWRHHAGNTFAHYMIETANRIKPMEKSRWSDFIADIKMQIESNYLRHQPDHSNPDFINNIVANLDRIYPEHPTLPSSSTSAADLLTPRDTTAEKNYYFRKESLDALKKELAEKLTLADRHSYRAAIQDLTGNAYTAEPLPQKNTRRIRTALLSFAENPSQLVDFTKGVTLSFAPTASLNAAPFVAATVAGASSFGSGFALTLGASCLSFVFGVNTSKKLMLLREQLAKPESKGVELKSFLVATVALPLSAAIGLGVGGVTKWATKETPKNTTIPSGTVVNHPVNPSLSQPTVEIAGK
jgi:hypothetical protein